MKPVKYVIVDDEPLARDALKKMASSIPGMEFAGECSNAIEAIAVLRTTSPDLLFLDINMPEITGIQLLKSLTIKPKVVLTTAYTEYAIDAYDLGVSDYLVKPISFERFYQCITKLFDLIHPVEATQLDTTKTWEGKMFFLKVDREFVKVFLEDIMYAEASGNFVKVVLHSKTHLVAETFSNFLQLLPPEEFIRVHKSYIVSLSSITKIIGNLIYIKNVEIPIGETYRKDFFDLLQKGPF